jgi:hypothetical protein
MVQEKGMGELSTQTGGGGILLATFCKEKSDKRKLNPLLKKRVH